MMKTAPYSLLKTALVIAGFVLTSHAATAGTVTYTESGDAGNGINGNAQLVTGAGGSTVSAINGNLSLTSGGVSEADAFKIYISAPSLFSASTAGFVPGMNNFDSQLFLFTLDGMGVVGNDDDGNVGYQSTIPAGTSFVSSLTAGYYYLVITGSGQNPMSALGDIFPNWLDAASSDPTGVYGPTGDGGGAKFSGFDGGSNEGGAYSIALTGVMTVPEPSSLALVLGALGAMTLRRRRS